MNRLSTSWDRMRNTPDLGRDLLIVAVLLLVGTFATVKIFANYNVRGPFSDSYVFSAEFDQAPAIQLASRQEVRIAGVSVGKITAAEPTSDADRAKLTMTIDTGHPVYRDARVVIRSKTPLNVMYVALDPGTPSAGELPEGDTIPMSQTERVIQPYEVLDELDARARSALTDLVNEADVALASAPQDLPPALASVDGAVQSLQPVLEQLDQRREHIRRIVTAVSLISTAAGADDQRLAQLMGDLEETLAVISDRDEELGASLDLLPGVTSTLRTSLTSAKALTTELDPVLAELDASTGKLPGTLEDLNSTVRHLRDIAVKARPVIKQARPIIADLRPMTADLDAALTDLSPVVANLPQATKRIVPWLDNLGAFVYNTSSSFSLRDADSGAGRASLVLKLYDPTGGGS